jgi:hypothetical protein
MTPGEFNIDFLLHRDSEKPWGVIVEFFLTKRTTEIVCLKKYG